MIRHPAAVVALLIAGAALATGCAPSATPPAGVSADDPRLLWFEENWGKRVILPASADVDADGRADLVVIYRVDAQKNAMRVVLAAPEGFRATNDVPAPIENQRITFRDIDDVPPLEFTVQGSKGPKLGYAVFRVEGGRLVNLFGHGMEDCCWIPAPSLSAPCEAVKESTSGPEGVTRR